MFQNQTILITGAASGMGKLCAERFAEEGANIVLADMNRDAIATLAENVNQKGGHALSCHCDVRDYQQVCAVVDQAVHSFGSIQILVTFAGGSAYRMKNVTPGTEFPNVPIEVYDWGIDVNFKGQFYFDHAVCKVMAENGGGTIINIGSVAGVEGNEFAVDYAASKSGVMNGLVKSVALYGEKHGIRCLSISPGPVMTRPGMAGMNTLLHRGAEPKELIDMVLFAASERGAFFNGVDILMDGGRSIVRQKNS